MTVLGQNERELNLLLRQGVRRLRTCVIIERVQFLDIKNTYVFIICIDFPQDFHLGICLSKVSETLFLVKTVIFQFTEVVLFLVQNFLLLNG